MGKNIGSATFQIALLILIATPCFGLNKEEWKTKTIYQVITDRFWRTDGSTEECKDIRKYCGGSWKGLTEKLDYISKMGFDAIWISPIQKNLPDSYHGYSITDLYKLNEHFGTQEDYDALAAKCKDLGISIMVDVVPNHMAAVMFNYTDIVPFNKPEHYHDYCRIQNMDYAHNQWRIVNCRLLDLPDLKQEDPYVNKTLLDWIENFVRDYKLDGLRLDAVPHMPHWFIREFNKAAAKGSGKDIYIVGECFDPRFDFVGSFQQDIDGLFNFPMFFKTIDVFKRGGDPQQLSDLWKSLDKYMGDVDALGLFLDNHDNDRFLNEVPKDEYFRLNNALAYIFFVRGIPVVYYGTEQSFDQAGDPYNRWPLWVSDLDENAKFYKYITLLVQKRKELQVWNKKFYERTFDKTFYSFQRGPTLVVTVNQKVSGDKTITGLDYDEGQKLCSIEDEKVTYTVSGGKVTVTIVDSLPLILVKC